MKEEFKNENLKDIIEKFKFAFLKSKSDRLRFILRCFLKNRDDTDIIRRVLTRLLDTT